MNMQMARLSIGSITLKETSLQAPAVGLTGKLDTSSSANDTPVADGGTVMYKTYIPSLFAEGKPIVCETLYDTDDYEDLEGELGKVQDIAVEFYNGKIVTFNGWLDDIATSQDDTVDTTEDSKMTLTIERTGTAIVITQAST